MLIFFLKLKIKKVMEIKIKIKFEKKVENINEIGNK